MGSLFKAPLFGEGAEEFFRNVITQLLLERKSSDNVSFSVFLTDKDRNIWTVIKQFNYVCIEQHKLNLINNTRTS